MMDRRDFLRVSVTLASAASCYPAFGAIERGRDYVAVAHQQPTPAIGEIEVLEFFSYTCPHCYHLESTIAPWAKKLPKGVAFRQVPVAFSNAAKYLAKAYYAEDGLGLHDRLHLRFFAALHEQNIPLVRDDPLKDWLARQGVDSKKFLDTMESFSVQSQVARAVQLAQTFDIESVPTLIVGGQYRTSVLHSGTQERLPGVLDELIQIVRREREGRPTKGR
jgi:thiol:disulfide interchange protein DsbA